MATTEPLDLRGRHDSPLGHDIEEVERLRDRCATLDGCLSTARRHAADLGERLERTTSRLIDTERALRAREIDLEHVRREREGELAEWRRRALAAESAAEARLL